MSFITDKQTLEDLNLTGKYKNDSLYNLFNQVSTRGGERLLDEMFQKPLTSATEINKRSNIFRYFQGKSMILPVDEEQVSIVENYLHAGGDENAVHTLFSSIRKKFLDSIGLRQEYETLRTGIYAVSAFVNALELFVRVLAELDSVNPFQTYLDPIVRILNDPRLKPIKSLQQGNTISFLKVMTYDFLLRKTLVESINILLKAVYHLDLCIAVSRVGRENGFSYALALRKEHNTIHLSEFYHPCLKKGVTNSIAIDKENNVIFLTGANMAGKSTFMKSFGISIYLAHMGFPIAAKEMHFSVKDGIYTSINVPDNLNLGYSHFYAEVLRVKAVAQEVSKSKHLLVIFDELFKGTNVKDAYDATLAVSEAFAEVRNCAFIISTHIIEVGETLRERCHNVQFVFLPTIMKGLTPSYSYKLQEGITKDRHGMMIIENEGIFEILAEDS